MISEFSTIGTLILFHVAFTFGLNCDWMAPSFQKEVETASLFKAFVQQYQNITFALFYWSKTVKSSQDSREEKLRSIYWCEVQQKHRERREIVRYHLYRVATISSFIEDRGCIDGFVWLFKRRGQKYFNPLIIRNTLNSKKYLHIRY